MGDVQPRRARQTSKPRGRGDGRGERPRRWSSREGGCRRNEGGVVVAMGDVQPCGAYRSKRPRRKSKVRARGDGRSEVAVAITVAAWGNILQFLKTLKEKGQKLFLLTNSPYYFVDGGMHSMDLRECWTELFDVVIAKANKSQFYTSEHPFRSEAASCPGGSESTSADLVDEERLRNKSWIIAAGGITNRGQLYGVGKVGFALRL
ncbi:hypothetical protein Fmac_001587 [Flemingia macrophylla]|uniref:Uncharacterized protein n=1 Tax=Flemingia macrophylla TaxID=520843 RepID=A0ABD1NHH9_9FABA